MMIKKKEKEKNCRNYVVILERVDLPAMGISDEIKIITETYLSNYSAAKTPNNLHRGRTSGPGTHVESAERWSVIISFVWNIWR